MKKILIAYFSASGVTAGVAKNLAAAVGGELFEIRPQTERDRPIRNIEEAC